MLAAAQAGHREVVVSADRADEAALAEGHFKSGHRAVVDIRGCPIIGITGHRDVPMPMGQAGLTDCGWRRPPGEARCR